MDCPISAWSSAKSSRSSSLHSQAEAMRANWKPTTTSPFPNGVFIPQSPAVSSSPSGFSGSVGPASRAIKSHGSFLPSPGFAPASGSSPSFSPCSTISWTPTSCSQLRRLQGTHSCVRLLGPYSRSSLPTCSMGWGSSGHLRYWAASRWHWLRCL